MYTALNNIIITQTENSDVGYVCLWSLKNSSYPQVVNETHSGATCLSFHRNHSHVYAIGLRDGSLAVYNMSVLTDEPQYITDFNAKHKGCVRQVQILFFLIIIINYSNKKEKIYL